MPGIWKTSTRVYWQMERQATREVRSAARDRRRSTRAEVVALRIKAELRVYRQQYLAARFFDPALKDTNFNDSQILTWGRRLSVKKARQQVQLIVRRVPGAGVAATSKSRRQPNPAAGGGGGRARLKRRGQAGVVGAGQPRITELLGRITGNREGIGVPDNP